jgi:hypothetical protein
MQAVSGFGIRGARRSQRAAATALSHKLSFEWVASRLRTRSYLLVILSFFGRLMSLYVRRLYNMQLVWAEPF